MSAYVDRHLPRLSEKAFKLRNGHCPKFDVRMMHPLDDEDKKRFTELGKAAGWETISFGVDGKDSVVEYRMPSIKVADPNAIQHCTTYC